MYTKQPFTDAEKRVVSLDMRKAMAPVLRANAWQRLGHFVQDF